MICLIIYIVSNIIFVPWEITAHGNSAPDHTHSPVIHPADGDWKAGFMYCPISGCYLISAFTQGNDAFLLTLMDKFVITNAKGKFAGV